MHICCAPCFIAPYAFIRQEKQFSITGFWFNDNIHPYTEQKKRLDTFLQWKEREDLPCIIVEDYQPELFFRRISGREDERCFFCYYFRLKETARQAKEGSFTAFSTTLLYSIYQNHDLIVKIGKEVALSTGVPFYYRDFRELWKEGVTLSKKEKMYRQSYCGCLYSERDRYCKG